MIFRRSGKDSGVRRGGADVCALGGVKAVRWGCVLWMLVLAVANARRFPHQMHTLLYRFLRLSLSAEGAS